MLSPRLYFVLFLYKFALGIKDFGVKDFYCNQDVMRRSYTVPNNVNSIRPADIDVVIALGDSLTAGNGAAATDLNGVKLQFRGLSFGAGGDHELEQHVTLPNIIKKFNPKLFGFSNGIGSINNWNSTHFNVAVPGSHAKSLSKQAKHLVSLLQQHSTLFDIKNDWKLVHIFIGANDLCDYCFNNEYYPEASANDIKEAIHIIQTYIPRTIVSITNVVHLEMLLKLEKFNQQCEVLHRKECRCLSQVSLSNLTEMVNRYNILELEIQNSKEFEKDDFTVVIQPFFSETNEPPKKNGRPDLSYFAPDCFHFSQYGHAIVSTFLWQNLLQPVGFKTRSVNISEPQVPLVCPDEECPFIRTLKNSANCTLYKEK